MWSEGNREMLYVCMRGVVCKLRATGRCYMRVYERCPVWSEGNR